MRMSGRLVSTVGRLAVRDLNLSQTASLIRNVTKSRLLSGHRLALTLTLIVQEEGNQSGQGRRRAAW